MLALSHKNVLLIQATQYVELQNCSIQEGNLLNIFLGLQINASVKADSHITCRAHAVPLPCRAAKGLECVFPI